MEDSLTTNIDKSTTVVTSASDKAIKNLIEQSVYDFQSKKKYMSSFYNEQNSSANFKISDIDQLALNAQSDIGKIQQINNIVRFFINKNDILGKVHEAIETNVNSDYYLSFPNYNEEEKEQYDEVKLLIEDFNEKIGLSNLIINSIPLTYSEGNYMMYLRKNTKGDSPSYTVDYFPLGVAEIADYNTGGDPYILVNIRELQSRLKKIYKKYKNNKPLFFDKEDKEIQDNYPKEVYDAYKNKEQYALLNIENTGVLRVNNLGRKYGLTPIFKSLKPVIRLENIEESDDNNIIARGKKIIFQKLRKELITDIDKIAGVTWNEALSVSHMELIKSLTDAKVSVYSGAPWVENVEFVEPKIEQTNVQNKNQYRSQIMTSVGISYLSTENTSVANAQISIAELMKIINKIGEQLATILEKWYRGILTDNNIDLKFTPKIRVIDSEKMSHELSLQFIEVLFNKLNCSYETVFKLAGIDVNDEYMKRKAENEKNYDEIFTPHLTSYTSSGKDSKTTNETKGGNPRESTDPNKEDYDKTRNIL